MAEVDGVISVLKATIDTLQGQLEVKDRQIAPVSYTHLDVYKRQDRAAGTDHYPAH